MRPMRVNKGEGEGEGRCEPSPRAGARRFGLASFVTKRASDRPSERMKSHFTFQIS